MILNANTSNILLDPNIEEQSLNGGTAPFNLAGVPLTNFRGTFATANVANGTVLNYRAFTLGSFTDEWEIGRGTYYSSNNTLTRDEIKFSSSNNTLVDFHARPHIIPQLPLLTNIRISDTNIQDGNNIFIGTSTANLVCNNQTIQLRSGNGVVTINVTNTTANTELRGGNGVITINTSNTTANVTISDSNSTTLITPYGFSVGNSVANSSSFSFQGSALPLFGEPGSRLSLGSGISVMTSDRTAQTSIYYTPHNHAFIPINNGSFWQWFQIAELTNDSTQSSTGKAGPSAVSTNKNYDLFVWNDSGTFRLTRGGAWNTDTVRSSSTENDITRFLGRWVNLNAITNGPGAGLGTYVGTVRSNGSSQIDFKLGGMTAGGNVATIGIWNLYNQKLLNPMVQDANTSWSYATTSWRNANASANNRIYFVRGLNEDFVDADYRCQTWLQHRSEGVDPDIVQYWGGGIGIGLDSSSTPSGIVTFIDSTTMDVGNVPGIRTFTANYAGLPGLGYHYFQALEKFDEGTASYFYGNGNQGLTVGIKY